jgi:hypothetical protein
MTVSPSNVQSELGVAIGAFENIQASGATTDRPQAGHRFAVNPATGTLEIAPAYRDKAAKALIREVRRMKLRLYLTFARLYLQKFVLECRSATARVRSDFLRQIGQLDRV